MRKPESGKPNKLIEALQVTATALARLTEGLKLFEKTSTKNPEHEALEDACIKRFETAFEYTWKLFKIAAEYQGQEAPGPRPALQEALRFGWIEDPEFWDLLLDARNGSVHDYFGVTHPEYLDLTRRFAQELPKSFDKIKTY